MSRIFFFIAEAFRALRRSASPSLAAIVTVVMTTLLLGVFIPVIKARLIMACAVRVASCPWFTPIVHQNETRLPR